MRKLTEICRLARPAFNRYAMMFGLFLLPFSSLRVLLLRMCGVKVGRGTFVGFNLSIDTNYSHLITIGDFVTISHNVSIYAHTATSVQSRLAQLYRSVSPVVIEDGAWIAASAIILPGVRIGENCLIGAGAVVTKSTDANSVYAGNPARKIRTLDFSGVT
jgi:acetyltransferase-like isoleucine patch superfamily enzyme